MGTAEVQGALWGARARDWADIQEPPWRPLFEAVLARAGVRAGDRHLDVGCGAGGALLVARAQGAEVAGLDASAGLVAIARERLPGARIERGEMEELPFADGSFDVVTGINAFQFAGDIVRALSQARRVLRPGGSVTMLTWGRREDCDLISGIMPAVFALLPAAPAPAAPPPAFAEPGVIEGLMATAGLSPAASGEIGAALVFPNETGAVRAVMSAGPGARAAQLVGDERLAAATAAALGRFTRANGSVALNNRFRWARAIRDEAATA